MIEERYLLIGESEDIFNLVYHYSMCDPKDKLSIRLAFNAACQCVIKCREMCDFGMAITYLDLAETKCSRYKDYHYLKELLKSVIKSASESKSGRSVSTSTHSSNTLIQHIDDLKMKLIKLETNTTFISTIYNYFISLKNPPTNSSSSTTTSSSHSHVNNSNNSNIISVKSINPFLNFISTLSASLFHIRNQKVKVYALG